MSFILIVGCWLALGAVAVGVMRHRGHDTFAWAVLFLFLGPLALPVAISSDRHRPADPKASGHDGGLDALIAHDGSPSATAALNAAIELLGGQFTSITLAAVVDLEASSTVRGRDTQREVQERLDALARSIEPRTDAPVDTIILFGQPVHALQHHATEHGYELIVLGSAGAARLGTRKLASTSPVPVLVGPVLR